MKKDWKFKKGNQPLALDPSFDDSKWESVSVPHDWAIYGPFKLSKLDKKKVLMEHLNNLTIVFN